MRWLLLDNIQEIECGRMAKARSRLRDFGFSPELSMIEMMAQVGALLLGAASDFREDVVFAKIERARFFPFTLSSPLRGEGKGEGQEMPLTIEATSDQLKPEGAWFEGSIWAKGGSIAQARFLLMNAGHLLPDSKVPLTFHPAFMNYFKVREKVKAS